MPAGIRAFTAAARPLAGCRLDPQGLRVCWLLGQAWRNRLEKIGTELAEQPARIEASYVVNARRLEPVGLIYLWPATG